MQFWCLSMKPRLGVPELRRNSWQEQASTGFLQVFSQVKFYRRCSVTETTETIVISGTKEAVEAIRQEIDAQSGSQTQLTERKNLDGDTASWIVIATLSVQALPHILDFIKALLVDKKQPLNSFRFSQSPTGFEVEIENPLPEDLERMRAMIDSQLKSKKKHG